MSDPFSQAQTEAFVGEPVHVAAPTTFDAPSDKPLIGAAAEWAKTGCHLTVDVPVGGKANFRCD